MVKEMARWSRREHLRLSSEYARVFRQRCSVSDGRLVVHAMRNELDYSRLGISVSKRVGGAVRRNYIRRRIREAQRFLRDEVPVGFDFVCVARPGLDARGTHVVDSLRVLYGRAVKRATERSAQNKPPQD